jgi:hypothetical protein
MNKKETKPETLRQAHELISRKSIALQFATWDFLLMLVLFSTVTLITHWSWLSGSETWETLPMHLGCEYYNVAKAVYEGRGFSDPFGDATGPTGWVSPVIPFTMASGLALFGGSKEWLTLAVLGLQIGMLAFTATACLIEARSQRNAGLMLVAISMVAFTKFPWLFMVTHDSVFHMFLMDLVILGLWFFATPPITLRIRIAWGVVGGITALSSPILGLTWAVATAWRWGPKNWRAIAVAAAVSMAVTTPWIAWQSVRLGKVVLIKSNAGFEIYQSQFLLQHGLCDEESTLSHPIAPNSAEGQLYRRLGESDFLAERERMGLESICQDPSGYLYKCGNRLLAVTIKLHCYSPSFENTIYFKLCQVFAALPFLGFLILVATRSSSAPPWACPAICCSVVYILPYVLVSYYERYGVALTLPQILFTYWFLLRICRCSFNLLANQTARC